MITLFDVEVPPNTRATVYIPATEQLMEADKEVKSSKGINVKGVDEKYTVVELGSGAYRFTGRLNTSQRPPSDQ